MPDWSQLSIGVASVALVFYVVREFRGLLRETLNFFGNHMTENVRTQAQVAQAVEKLAGAVEGMTSEAQAAHAAAAVAHAKPARRVSAVKG